MNLPSRKYPLGAEVTPNGTDFRLFAPKCKKVEVALETDKHNIQYFSLASEGNGYFSGTLKNFSPGSLYRFRLDDDDNLYPDPASRFQPDGPFGPSQIIDSSNFAWSDKKWNGITMENQILYEMHIGTFTKEGTYAAAKKQLKELAKLGITTIELMPLNEFPGAFGWGYDGVNLFAPTRLYGTIDELKDFINAAHHLNLGVILDVVYNHFGPSGNFISKFSDDFFSKEHTEWGKAINFENKDVRLFFLMNVQYWIQEYHFDGLRLDATHSIFDKSKPHILLEIASYGHEAVKNRSVIIIAENESQESILIRSSEKGGYNLDGIWNDDFHHTAMVRLTGKREAYYMDYTGHPQEFISCLKYGFLYQGQYYKWQKRFRGTPYINEKPNKFILFIQNHDQIANSGKGKRIHQMTDEGSFKTMSCFFFLAPGTPMLFQGQEFASSSPFLYFVDQAEELWEPIKKGRQEFLTQFAHLSSDEVASQLPNPNDKELFLKSKIDFSERNTHHELYQFHKDLIKLRKTDPIFSRINPSCDGAILNDDAFLVRFFSEDKQDRLLLFNFGKDYEISPVSTPLLAPCEGCSWEVMLNTENLEYGGSGFPPFGDLIWILPARSAVVLKTIKKQTS